MVLVRERIPRQGASKFKPACLYLHISAQVSLAALISLLCQLTRPSHVLHLLALFVWYALLAAILWTKLDGFLCQRNGVQYAMLGGASQSPCSLTQTVLVSLMISAPHVPQPIYPSNLHVVVFPVRW